MDTESNLTMKPSRVCLYRLQVKRCLIYYVLQVRQGKTVMLVMYRWEGKLMRMHTAVQVNDAIRSRSSQAQLVIVNFPAPPSKLAAEENCFLLY